MFSDPAKALHNLSVSVLTVGIFLAFIRFIETVAETMDLFWPALGIFIGSSFGAYVIAVFISGFARLVENSDKMAGNTPSQPASPVHPQEPVETRPPLAPPVQLPGWTCQNCGTVNPGQRKYCYQCNTSRDWKPN